MKTTITLLFALLFMSCSPDEFNRGPAVKETVHKNHDAVPEYMTGRYISVEGQTNYLPGTIEITPVSVVIDVPGYVYSIDLASNNYSTFVKIDCYLRIYFPDGTMIEINDWIVWGNEIRLVVKGQFIIRLVKVADQEPEQPEAPQQPEQPVKEEEPIKL
ncbi:hypothetical protein [Flavobacterium sp. NRK1]|uniref:hypothetical protein n=1 Tax=Flavobacterium sp. NRK1 TaxID=2954929 RepID=UPI0020931DE3|nr:hypothetical protein [Flavobacterium sp. NRK1]MCO6149074.1 hypothetical protein [Flavobacterium sp. NRK1]